MVFSVTRLRSVLFAPLTHPVRDGHAPATRHLRTWHVIQLSGDYGVKEPA
jgi:hypothetical protein